MSAVRQIERLQYVSHNTIFIKVFQPRMFNRSLPLTEYTDRDMIFSSRCGCHYRRIACKSNRESDTREQHEVTHGNYGEVVEIGCRTLCRYTYVNLSDRHYFCAVFFHL